MVDTVQPQRLPSFRNRRRRRNQEDEPADMEQRTPNPKGTTPDERLQW